MHSYNGTAELFKRVTITHYRNSRANKKLNRVTHLLTILEVYEETR